jgi:hypothetical protein
MIDHFVPVGNGIELRPPAFQMRVKNVEEGSPAAASRPTRKGPRNIPGPVRLSGASSGIRTQDLRITNALLCH